MKRLGMPHASFGIEDAVLLLCYHGDFVMRRDRDLLLSLSRIKVWLISEYNIGAGILRHQRHYKNRDESVMYRKMSGLLTVFESLFGPL